MLNYKEDYGCSGNNSRQRLTYRPSTASAISAPATLDNRTAGRATLNSSNTGGFAMSSITFDTLQVVKKLETKGFDQNQAEGISDALKDVLQTADIATKSDINLVDKQLSEAATKGDLEKVRAELKIDIEKIRAELIKWYVGIAAAQIIGLGYIILRATGKA
jgi:hypothetical protein